MASKCPSIGGSPPSGAPYLDVDSSLNQRHDVTIEMRSPKAYKRHIRFEVFGKFGNASARMTKILTETEVCLEGMFRSESLELLHIETIAGEVHVVIGKGSLIIPIKHPKLQIQEIVREVVNKEGATVSKG